VRLWSIHPKYLDQIGIVALWREGLLAQKVLLGNTKGYTRHPQLDRFKQCDNPVGAIASYLHAVAVDATRRGYNFTTDKIDTRRFTGTIAVASGQASYEFSHLLKKLAVRSPEQYQRLLDVTTVTLHPLFHRVKGEVAGWEKGVVMEGAG